MVERVPVKDKVAGSNPAAGALGFGSLSQRKKSLGLRLIRLWRKGEGCRFFPFCPRAKAIGNKTQSAKAFSVGGESYPGSTSASSVQALYNLDREQVCFVYIALPDVSKPATLFTFAFELEVRVNITSVYVSIMIQKCTIAETQSKSLVLLVLSAWRELDLFVIIRYS